MTEDEIRLKLTMDQRDLDEGTRRATASIGRFGQETGKSFLHAESAGRGFKKMIHELSEESPLLGSALRLAISPIGGLFALATVGIASATKALDEFNKKLDETAKINAQGAKGEHPLLAFFRRQDAAREQADFEREQVAKSNPITGKFEDLQRQAMAIEKELNRARRDANNQKVAGGLKMSPETVALIQAKITELEQNAPANPGKEPGSIEGLLPTWYSGAQGGIPGIISRAEDFRIKNAAYEDAQKKITDYKNLLKEANTNLVMLNQTEKENRELVQAKTKDFDRMLDALRKNLPTSNALPWQGMRAAGAQIDPNTGGIELRGIADMGGIAYQPIPGAPKYSPQFTPSANNLGQSQVADALSYALKNGFPIIGTQ